MTVSWDAYTYEMVRKNTMISSCHSKGEVNRFVKSVHIFYYKLQNLPFLETYGFLDGCLPLFLSSIFLVVLSLLE